MRADAYKARSSRWTTPPAARAPLLDEEESFFAPGGVGWSDQSVID
jgi:hypothetical protein